jgi:hypothetical protein
MSRAPETTLRRYVLERAAGRVPRQEYVRYDSDIGAWVRCDEATARDSAYWRRLRKPAAPWCGVLSPRTDNADDDALEAFFATVPEDGWQHLAARIGKRPMACLREWKKFGRRILDAVSDDHPRSKAPPGKLAGWPIGHGTGRRGLQARLSDEGFSDVGNHPSHLDEGHKTTVQPRNFISRLA